MSNDPLSASLDLRAVQSSPVHSRTADGRRPRSSQGEDPSKKKGLGLKEMEQTLSTLHKQNFDLKLELYHRRERQSALEERAERAESEKVEVEEMNDKLLQELEKRDKAVEEAVAMIVTLEAKVEQLLREREMVRRVDTDGYFYSGSAQGFSVDRSDTPTTTGQGNAAKPSDHDRVLARMPSFLSERSEGTENLRNVYLGVRGSLVSLPRMPEEGRDAGAAADLNGINSPSLSVLSESSFMSVYGQKAQGTSRNPANPEDPSPLDGLSDTKNGTRNGSLSKSMTQAKSRGSISRARSGSGHYQNIGDVLETSPLQKLENLEKALAAMDDASRPSTKDKAGDGQSRRNTPSTRSPSRPKTKEEKREALRRVMTDASQMGGLRHSNGLPPTPDTISTSTLRHLKNSNDTLSQQQATERSYLALSETTTSGTLSRGNDMVPSLNGDVATKPAPALPFTGTRREFSGSGSYFDNRLPIPPRPRSADETTVSHHRRNDWDSASSDDDMDGVDSTISSYDYWMRESLKPDRFLGHGQAPPPGRGSPDLFSFPGTTSGWATDAMFGSLGGSGYLGSTPTPLAPALDALGESLPAPLFGSGLAGPIPGAGVGPPPPPNRRSSLHARTGSSHGAVSFGASTSGTATPSHAPAANGKPRKSPERPSRARSNSTGSQPRSGSRTDQAYRRQAPPAINGQQQPSAKELPPKPRQYPPLSGQGQQQQQSAPRNRSLNTLFRRSIGASTSQQQQQQQQPPSSAPPTETTFASSASAAAHQQQQPLSTVGIPSWGRRQAADVFDDDRAGATPPPILRNRVPGRGSLDGGEAAAADAAAWDAPEGYHGSERYAPVNGGGGSERLKSMPARVGRAMQNGPPVAVARAAPGTSAGPMAMNGNIAGAGGLATNGHVAGGAAAPVAMESTQQQQPPPPQGKKKWLGLGRMGSLRGRAG